MLEIAIVHYYVKLNQINLKVLPKKLSSLTVLLNMQNYVIHTYVHKLLNMKYWKHKLTHYQTKLWHLTWFCHLLIMQWWHQKRAVNNCKTVDMFTKLRSKCLLRNQLFRMLLKGVYWKRSGNWFESSFIVLQWY